MISTIRMQTVLTLHVHDNLYPLWSLSPYLVSNFRSPFISLWSFKHASSITTFFPFVSSLSLPFSPASLPPEDLFAASSDVSEINKIKKGMLFVSPVFLSSPSAPLFLFLFLFGLTGKNENGESENKREEDEKGETTLSPSRACVHVSEETREAIWGRERERYEECGWQTGRGGVIVEYGEEGGNNGFITQFKHYCYPEVD